MNEKNKTFATVKYNIMEDKKRSKTSGYNIILVIKAIQQKFKEVKPRKL